MTGGFFFMRNFKHRAVSLIAFVAVLLVGVGIYMITTKISTDQTHANNLPPSFPMKQEERDLFLDTMVQNEEWLVIVNATNDAIKNNHKLIEDDMRFWSARAIALLKLNQCTEAGASAYHILTREPENELALAIVTNAQNKDVCIESSSSD